MNDYSTFFDASSVDTPEGLTPSATIADAADGVPLSGTGLAGGVYAPGTPIRSVDDLRDIIAATQAPDLIFTAQNLSYGNSDTSVTTFLAEDGASLSGDGTDIEMGPSGLSLSGFIYIPAGVHEISVVSDDGFDLQIGGMEFSSVEGTRAVDTTARVAEFEGGLYQLDMLYFDEGGKMALNLLIDGVTVQPSALFNTVE